MSRRAQRSKLCPTPSKTRYYTEDDAADAGARFERQIVKAGRELRAFYIYACDCRTFHLTHHPFSREGFFLRKATP